MYNYYTNSLPLIIILIILFSKFNQKYSQFMTSLFVSISSILSIIVFFNVLNYGYSNNLLISSWINSGTLNVNWSIKVDALSSLMMVVVTLVSALVHIYSIGYMSHDPHKPRFMNLGL